jgi:hypothetical protein
LRATAIVRKPAALLAIPEKVICGVVAFDSAPSALVELRTIGPIGLPPLRIEDLPTRCAGGTQIQHVADRDAITTDDERIITHTWIRVALPSSMPIGTFTDTLVVRARAGYRTSDVTVAVAAEVADCLRCTRNSAFFDGMGVGDASTQRIELGGSGECTRDLTAESRAQWCKATLSDPGDLGGDRWLDLTVRPDRPGVARTTVLLVGQGVRREFPVTVYAK